MPAYILVNEGMKQEMFQELCMIKIKQEIKEQSN